MHSCAAYKCISNRSEDVYTLNFNAQMDLKPCMRQALYAASHSFYHGNYFITLDTITHFKKYLNIQKF